MDKSTPYILQVCPRIPARLARLEELANNLWYSWDRPTRALFARLHPGLWKATAFLRSLRVREVESREDQWLVDGRSPIFNANTPEASGFDLSSIGAIAANVRALVAARE